MGKVMENNITKNNTVAELENEIYKLNGEIQAYKQQIADLTKIIAVNKQLRNKIVLAETRAYYYQQQVSYYVQRLSDIYESNSWVITAPIRMICSLIKLEKNTFIYKFLKNTYLNLKKYPKLLKIIRTIALKIPFLKKVVPPNDNATKKTIIFSNKLDSHSKIIYKKIVDEIEKVKSKNTKI